MSNDGSLSDRNRRNVDALRVIVSFDNGQVNKDIEKLADEMAKELGMVIPNKRKAVVQDSKVVALEIQLSPEFIDFETLTCIYRVMGKVGGFRDMYLTLEKLELNNNLKKNL